jgi:hypothetical protein
MATNLDYQKARRIRNASFTDILSDQLAGDTTIRGAIRKTISLRTQARVKGFKEKFDPLNIAKFLTGGSSLGPALLGKLTGRSQRDIQYFSGRMQPIRERGTASRIGKEPGTGSSEGVNEMLRKIYYLMQITRERDLQRSDTELNFAEEKKLEDEKRHKQLLDALSKLNKGEGTASEENDNRGFLDSLMDLLRRIPNAKLPSGLGGGRGKAARAASALVRGISGIVTGVVTSPAFVIAAAPTMLAFLVSKEKEAIEADPFNPKYDNNPYALSLRNNTTAGQEGKKNTAKALTQQGTARRGEIQMALDSKTPEDVLQERYGADEKTLRTWLSDPKNQLWTKPNVETQAPAPAAAPPASTVAPQPAPAAAAPPAPPTMGGFNRMPGASTTSAVPVSAAPATGSSSMPSNPMMPAAPPAVPGTNLGQRLSSASAENLNSNLPTIIPAAAPSVVNNVNTTQSRQMPQNAAELNTIAVRNMDSTFMRLIMDNTRVV